MLFYFQNCSDLLEEKKCSRDQGKLEAEGREFAKICERSGQFLKENTRLQNTIFILLFGIPIRSGTFEQSKYQLEQIIATGTR